MIQPYLLWRTYKKHELLLFAIRKKKQREKKTTGRVYTTANGAHQEFVLCTAKWNNKNQQNTTKHNTTQNNVTLTMIKSAKMLERIVQISATMWNIWIRSRRAHQANQIRIGKKENENN